MAEGGHDAAAHAAIRALESDLRAFKRNVEVEMGQMSAAVVDMHKDMVSSLNELGNATVRGLEVVRDSTVHGLQAVQQATAEGLQQVQESSEAGFHRLDLSTTSGFTDTVRGLGSVDGSVGKLTQGMVQMQLIAVHSEAQRPLNTIKRFAEEIGERYGKALEKVASIRSSYDAVIGTTLRAYDGKVREIGSHIYEIYDCDFRDQVEKELTAHLVTHWVVPKAVQLAQCASRDAQLDQDLERLKQDHLLPLVQAESALDAEIRNRFAVPLPAAAVEVAYVPALVVTAPGGDRKVYCGNPVERDADALHGACPHLDEQRSWAKVAQQVDARAASDLPLQAQPLRNLAEVKKRLDAMVGRGELSAERRAALDLYLDTHGLQFLTGGAPQRPA